MAKTRLNATYLVAEFLKNTWQRYDLRHEKKYVGAITLVIG
jgi:hypothetical protein